METKPLVTCHGDQSLFSSLHPIIAQGLPHDAVEWKRSYGRAAKVIRLEASFVPYDDDILPNEDERMLVSRPFYHIFWTDCDLDMYRQTTKDEIQEWQTALKSRNIPDWMIVILVRDEHRGKSKLLPRTSVIDKIRNDFCHKHSDRCVVLYESSKSDQKSLESWVNFYAKLRQQLLEAFNRNLSKFEDYLRALRERRNDADWNFVDFFLLQEELAFIYEMIGIYDDALIQYDELDALFTQFVINQSEAACPEWLKAMVKTTSSAWDSLSLAKSIDLEQRQRVKSKTASLLQLRNYLFSRQAALLFLLKRPWEVAQRGMEHLHNIVQERKMLQTETEPCAESCWVFLGCMEILNACNKYGSENDIPVYSVYMANLWDYARRKLKELGQVSGLMPDTCKTDKSSSRCDQIIDLLKKMGIPDKTMSSRTGGETSTVEKLREALTSQEAFQKHYLELSELAMGTFKHIGRLRSARLIGKDLAQFYMQRNEPHKAELFLSDAIKMYKREGWDMLAEDTRLDLAQCQEKIGNRSRYMRSACQLASSELLMDEQRNKYFTIIMDVAKTHESPPLLIKAQNCFTFKSMALKNERVIIDDEIELELDIYCSFPDEITCDTIKLYMIKQPDFFMSPLSGLRRSDDSQRSRHISQASSNTSSNDPMMTFNPVTPLCPKVIDLLYHCDRNTRPDFVLSSGIVCPSAHSVLRRTDSGPPPKHEAELETVVTDWCLSADDVSLWPGSNVFSLKCKQTQHKAVFKLDQLSIQCGAIRFLKNQLLPSTFVTVMCEEPEFDISPVDLDSFVAGITQNATLCLHAGSLAIPAGSQVTVHAPISLVISQTNQNEDPANSMTESAFESPSGAEDRGIATAVNRECLITLDAGCPANETLNIAVNMFAEIQDPKTASTEYKLTFECLWSGRTYDCGLTVYRPFQIKHSLHTSGKRKFIQMMVSTDCCVQLTVSKSRLNVSNSVDVELLALNKANQCLPVSRLQSSSFIWELKRNTGDTPPVLDMQFDFRYVCDTDTAAPPEARRHHYAFTLTNYKTLFSVNSQIKPQGDETSIQVGQQCALLLNIRPMKCAETKAIDQLMYEVHNDKFWAISGKVTGVVKIKRCTCFVASLEAMPLVAGYLPLPVISLVKYTPKPSDDRWQQDTGDVDDIAELFGEERRGVSPPRVRTPMPVPSQSVSPISPDSGDLGDTALHGGDVNTFAKGEVFLSYAGMQIQVNPQPAAGEAVQVTIETGD